MHRDRLAAVAASWWLLAVAACGGSNREGTARADTGAELDRTAPSDAPDGSKRLLCPACTQQAGGETSDFGENSALVVGGAASSAAPNPCKLGEQRSQIDEAAARALGFGAVLDRLSTSFEQPLAWTPRELGLGQPATGYTPQTTVLGSLRVTAIEHVVPSLAGCVESLQVGLATHLETADGALSIEGTLQTEVQRDSVLLMVGGLLDLSTARGTLELFPPPTDEDIAGFVAPLLYLWPDDVRIRLQLSVFDLRDIDSDVRDFAYAPLEGNGPPDGCRIEGRLRAFNEPLLSGNGASLATVFAELRGWLAERQPLAASWLSGAATSVTVELGDPVRVCELANSFSIQPPMALLSYQVPFALRSADGRVSIERKANAFLRLDQGKWSDGWFEIFPLYDDGQDASSSIVDPLNFAAATGISGVDFGELGGGFWHTELYFGQLAPQLTGEVTVEGVDTDGHLTGFEGAILPEPIERLTW